MKNNYLNLLIQGLFVGLFAGIVVSLYRLCLSNAFAFSLKLYSCVSDSPLKIIAMFLVLAFLGIIIGAFIHIDSMITGSGIPQVLGILMGKMEINWLGVMILKFIGGVISLGAGLSLGREGPSVQIGAVSGIGVSKLFKNNSENEKIMLIGGSAAGLSAAFNAPFAGVLFACEELSRNLSKKVLLTALTAVVTADCISKAFFGIEPVFNVNLSSAIPLSSYPLLIILGIVLGITGVIFNAGIYNSVRFYNKTFKLPVYFKPVLSFMLTGAVALFMPCVLGGGHELVEKLFENNYALSFLLIMLIVKFIFTLFCYSSSAPGGIFLPLLSIGAVIGAFTGTVFANLSLIDSSLIPSVIVLAMAGYFSAVVKSPLTGMVLLAEMSGGFGNFTTLAIVCFTAYVVSDIFNGKPIYELLLSNMLRRN